MNTLTKSMSRICVSILVFGVFASLLGQGAEFLIITHDDFAQAIQGLAEWKYMKGISTKVVKLSDIGLNPDTAAIRNYIINAYNTWDPQPEHVLLVGDIGFLPTWKYAPRSDNYYASVEGDFKAELSVGRFPCQTSNQCSTMVHKILAYERTPYLEDTLWFKKSTIAIRFDSDSDTVGYYVGDLRYIRDTCMIPAGFSVDSLFYLEGSGWHSQGPDSATQVINVLNEGRGFFVYRGHSVNLDWKAPFRGIPDSARLSNGSKLPIIFAGSCTSVLFSTSVGEKWLRAGSPSILKGAVAYIGNTQTVLLAYWRPHLNRAFFKAICLEDSLILGHAFLRAKDSLYTVYPESEEFYAECNLVGDPTLQLWTEVPQAMTVDHRGAIEIDVPINLVVSVEDSASLQPIQGALVTLYKPGATEPEVFQSEATNSEGEAMFEDLTVPSPGTLHVTATLGNYVPYQGEIEVYEMITDNPLALAYNGNRHLVRKPNSEEFHLAYTREGDIVYRYSSNAGSDWSVPVSLGEGEYPAITLSSDYLPSVTWTDDNGGLWYRRKASSTQWSDTFHVWNPVGVNALRLNSPPSIAMHPSNPNTMHILVTRTGGPPIRDVSHKVEDYTFTITQPMQGTFVLIEQATGPQDPPLRSFPSIASCEVDNSLHAVWQRVDTVCYAEKPRDTSWINWGWQFDSAGLQSTHPFVETYGDSIFVVWQHIEQTTMKEDVYRAERYLTELEWRRRNLSLTPNTKSLYPVNASGFFTVFADEIEPPVDSRYEIFYKVEPDDPRVNLSQTEFRSIYPQAAARFYGTHKYLYTSWLEGDESPYEIRFKRTEHVDPEKGDQAYLTSPHGYNLPSPYLVARDSFISDWQVPVDVGNMTTTYQFPLVPGYAYKARAVVYHEASGPWSGRIKIDNNLQFVVTHNAHTPETLECWIPPALYEDSIVTVSFNRITGDFAAIGPIYIYRYEYDGGGGGPMSQQSSFMNSSSIAIFPNPFKEQLHILNQTPGQDRMNLKLYDVTGRLVKCFDQSSNAPFDHIIWDGLDDNRRNVSQGVYFLNIDNLDTGDIICRKILRIR